MPGRPALFVDRDGVINVDHGYVHTIDQFTWLPGVFETARLARSLGLVVVVVTNQAGIARGYYSESQFLQLTSWMTGEFAREQALISAVYYCPYHRDGMDGYRVDNHPDRKPNPGMLYRAATELGLDLAASVMLGDSEADIEAGRRASLRSTAILTPVRPQETLADRWVADHSGAQAWLREIYAPCSEARAT